MARNPEKSKSAAAKSRAFMCPTCGSAMRSARGVLPVLVNGEEVRVPGVAHLRCPSCKEMVVSLEAARRQTESAFAT
jgi:YgiT-type zinc finger domain-containing protein